MLSYSHLCETSFDAVDDEDGQYKNSRPLGLQPKRKISVAIFKKLFYLIF